MCFRSLFSSFIAFLYLIIFLVSCAEARRPIRNPVVFIPGIMGSRLQVDGKEAWGAYRLTTVKPTTPEGADIISLHLDVPQGELCERQAEPPKKTELKDLRHFDASFGLIHRFGGIYFYAAKPIYDPLYVFLESLGYQSDTPRSSTSGKGFKFEGLTIRWGQPEITRSSCISFYYDWRRDNIENACLLDRFLKKRRLEIIARTRKEIARLRSRDKEEDLVFADKLEEWLEKPFKFDIIAHSMGGLVARYYLRYGAQDIGPDGQLPDLNWAGEKEIDKLILVGTPNLGTATAMDRLLGGLIIPELDKHDIRYHPSIIGSMPSVYQLLPRLQHARIVDQQGNAVPLFDVDVWEKNQWGLMVKNDDPILRAVLRDKDHAGAKNYLRWCLKRAEKFHQALDMPGEPATTRIFLISGILQYTLLEARAHQGDKGLLEFNWSNQQKILGGDGTVPIYSAIFFDPDHMVPSQPQRTWIVPGEHVQLMAHKGVTTILSAILESPSDMDQ